VFIIVLSWEQSGRGALCGRPCLPQGSGESVAADARRGSDGDGPFVVVHLSLAGEGEGKLGSISSDEHELGLAKSKRLECEARANGALGDVTRDSVVDDDRPALIGGESGESATAWHGRGAEDTLQIFA